MILHVEERDRGKYAEALNQYFRLRKRVFHDQLGWEVPVSGDIERDRLDDTPCTYTLYLDADGMVAGGARLIPTTQTTLLDMAFDGLVPEDISFRSPTIWEISRYCINHDIAQTRMTSGGKMATVGLSLGNYDYAMKVGISHYIAVVEANVFQLSQSYNLDVEVISEKQINNSKVVCALYPISEKSREVADRLRPMVA